MSPPSEPVSSGRASHHSLTHLVQRGFAAAIYLPSCLCGGNSVGRVPAFQADCREFESRPPLHPHFADQRDSLPAFAPRKGPATALRHHLTGQKRSLEVAHEAKACVICGSCPGGYATCARAITLPLIRPGLLRVNKRSPGRPEIPCPMTWGSVHATFLVSQRTGGISGGWFSLAVEAAINRRDSKSAQAVADRAFHDW